jgi:hypothetical protein
MFTDKLYVRDIDGKNKLLEFYISRYPNENDRKTNLLVSTLKKAMKNPRVTDMFDIHEVGFITHRSIGAPDFHEYQYKIIDFDKIVEHNGYYVVKFKAEIMVDGVSLVEQYRMGDLDERYENLEMKRGDNNSYYTKGDYNDFN